MPIFLDVVTKLSRTAALEAARDAERIFGRASRVIADDFGKATGGLFDDLAFRAERGRAALDGMQRNLQRTADAEAEAARRMERSRTQTAIAETRLTEVREKHGDTSSKAMAAELGLADARARAGRDTRDYVDALNATEAAYRRVNDATTDAAESTGRFSGVLGGISGRALAIGGVTTAVVGLGVAIAKSVPSAAQFQAELMKLHTAADIPTSQLGAVSKMVLDLAPQVGVDPTELMNGAYFVAKSGQRNSTDMRSVLGAGAQMAAIEGVPLETALNAITTQISDYNLKASDAGLVGSQIVTAAGAGKVPLGEFSGAMHVVEPVAAKMGIAAPQWMAMVAQMTQSGMHADQAGQDVLHLIEKVQAPTHQMLAEWGALGLDPNQVKTQFAANPLATIDKLDKALDAHTDANGMVGINANYQNIQVQQSMQQMLASMNDQQRKVADRIASGELTYKDFRKSRGGMSEEDLKKVEQFNTLFQQSKGFSQLLASGQGSTQTRQQAIQALIGDQVSGQAFQQLTGEANSKAQATAANIAGSKPDAKGDVEGSAEALDTFQGNVKKAGAAWDSLKISMGTAFLPAATTAMHGLNDGLDFLIKHKTGIGQAFSAVGDFFKEVGGGMADDVKMAAGWVDDLWHAIDGAWHTADNFGHGVGHVADEIIHGFERVAHAHPLDGLVHGVEGLLKDLRAIPDAIEGVAGGFGKLASKGFGGVEHLLHLPGHAGGGPIVGDGPNGVDSQLAMLAPGEHVWTDDEVAGAGGHGAMFRMRAMARSGALQGFERGGHRAAPGLGQGGISLDGPDAPHGPDGTKNDPLFTKPAEPHHGHGRHSNHGEDATPGPGNDGLGAEPRHSGKRGGKSDVEFGAELDDGFGLKDGLPGLAKWFVTFLGDMAIAPAEGAMLGSLLRPPNGQDTQLSWLQPGEFVEPKSAVNKLGTGVMNQVRGGQLPHYAGGGTVGDDEPTAPGQPMGSTGGAKPGLSISGGALGAAEGAGAMAADMFAPGSGAAVQIVSQMLNRTVAYGGQLAAIGVEGLMSTFLPSDDPLSDFGNTLPGKILSGVAGAKPASPVVAGNTKSPLQDENTRNQQQDAKPAGDTHVHMYNPTIQTKDMTDFKQQANARTGTAVAGTTYAVPAGPR